MMKTLIVLNGPMGVGKTTVGKELCRRLTPSIFLDGDWCWDLHPFSVTDATKALVMDNIRALLRAGPRLSRSGLCGICLGAAAGGNRCRPAGRSG